MGKEKFEEDLRSIKIITNYKLEKVTNGANIVRFIKAQGLKWLWH